jgi:hypothetical protein
MLWQQRLRRGGGGAAGARGIMMMNVRVICGRTLRGKSRAFMKLFWVGIGIEVGVAVTFSWLVLSTMWEKECDACDMCTVSCFAM